MIKTHSDDPDVKHAAQDALVSINGILQKLPVAETFDYGGHILKIGEYGVCTHCTKPIAEAQAAQNALLEAADSIADETIKDHLELAAQLFKHEADTAIVRAEFHNGHGTEAILNRLLGFAYERGIGEEYNHSHHQGAEES